MTDDDGLLAPPDAIDIPDEAHHTDDWKQEMAGVDRVISVALTIKQPRTVDWVADKAEISPTAARDHLERLVDLHVLSAVEQRGAKTYYPDAGYRDYTQRLIVSKQAPSADFELVREGDFWVATHVETGIASQGESPTEAVEMTEEAVRLHQQEHRAGDEEHQRAILERFSLDIDPDSESIDTPDGMP